MKELKVNMKRIFDNDNDNDNDNDTEIELIAHEMQKRVLWESESLITKILSGLLT